MGLRAFMYVTGFLTSVLLARALGPEGRGIYAFPAVITALLVMITHLSLEQGHVFLAARDVPLRTLWGNTLFATALLSAGSTALLAVLYALGGSSLFGGLPGSWVGVGAGAVPLYLVTIFWTNLLQLDRRLVVACASLALASLVQLGLCGALYAAGALTPFRALLTLFAYPAASSVLLLAASIRAGLADPRLDRPTLSRCLAFGLKAHLGMLAFYMLLRLDALLVQGILGYRELGLYSLATSSAEALWLLLEPMSAALLPHQVRASKNDERRLAFATARTSIWLALLAGIICWLGAPYGFRVIYGSGFTDAVWPFRLLIPGVVALVIQRPLLPIVIKEGRAWLVSGLGLSMLALNIAANLALLGSVGIAGASIASSVCYVMLAAAYVIVTRERRVVGFRDLIPKVTDFRRFLPRSARELRLARTGASRKITCSPTSIGLNREGELSGTTLSDTDFWDEQWRSISLPVMVRPEVAGPYLRTIIEHLTAFIPAHKPLDVLEIGAAPGGYLAHLATRFPEARVHGLDYSPVGCEVLRENFALLDLPVTVYQRDVVSDSLDDLGPFDVVYSLGLIEHFDPPDSVVAKHAMLVRPGGVLILGVPSFLGINRLLMKVFNYRDLKLHNLRVMDVQTWDDFERELNLVRIFRGYVGGWEPSIYARKGDSALDMMVRASWVVIARAVESISRRRSFNSRLFSGYAMGVYRVPWAHMSERSA